MKYAYTGLPTLEFSYLFGGWQPCSKNSKKIIIIWFMHDVKGSEVWEIILISKIFLEI